jgi:heat shock protein 1/8
MDPADKTAVESKIEETISWLDANPAAEKEEYEEKQKELEGIAMPILQKMGGAGGAGGMPAGMPDMGGMPGGGAAGAPAGDDPAGGPTIEEID